MNRAASTPTSIPCNPARPPYSPVLRSKQNRKPDRPEPPYQPVFRLSVDKVIQQRVVETRQGESSELEYDDFFMAGKGSLRPCGITTRKCPENGAHLKPI